MKYSWYGVVAAYDHDVNNIPSKDFSKVKNLVFAHRQSQVRDARMAESVNWSLFVEEEDKLLFLAFRGSTSSNDWLINASLAPANINRGTANKEKVFVHGGYLSAVDNCMDGIKEQLQPFAKKGGYKLCPTGHSLGGGLTQMFALLYDADPCDNLPLHDKIYSFAAPMILWAFNTSVPNVVSRITNICNYSDLVPRMMGEATEDIVYVQANQALFEGGMPSIVSSLTAIIFTKSIGGKGKIQVALQKQFDSMTLMTGYQPCAGISMILPKRDSVDKEILHIDIDTLSAEEKLNESLANPEDKLALVTRIQDLNVREHMQPFYLHMLSGKGFFRFPLKTNKFYIKCSENGKPLDLSTTTKRDREGELKEEDKRAMWTLDGDDHLKLVGSDKVIGYEPQNFFHGDACAIEMVAAECKEALKWTAIVGFERITFQVKDGKMENKCLDMTDNACLRSYDKDSLAQKFDIVPAVEVKA